MGGVGDLFTDLQSHTGANPFAINVWGHRNDREELALNIGGYRGAPDTGEFAAMMENHTGQSGPRTELLELLDWLRRLRRRQRFLGFKESELTYLYDIPVWVVDNCAGVCEIYPLFYFLLQESPPHLAISCHLRHLRHHRE